MLFFHVNLFVYNFDHINYQSKLKNSDITKKRKEITTVHNNYKLN